MPKLTKQMAKTVINPTDEATYEAVRRTIKKAGLTQREDAVVALTTIALAAADKFGSKKLAGTVYASLLTLGVTDDELMFYDAFMANMVKAIDGAG